MAGNNNNQPPDYDQLMQALGNLTNNVNTVATSLGVMIQNQAQQQQQQHDPNTARNIQLYKGILDKFDLLDPNTKSLNRTFTNFIEFYRANSNNVPADKLLQIWKEQLTENSKKSFERKRVETEISDDEKKYLLNSDRPPGDNSSTFAQYLNKNFATKKMFETNYTSFETFQASKETITPENCYNALIILLEDSTGADSEFQITDHDVYRVFIKRLPRAVSRQESAKIAIRKKLVWDAEKVKQQPDVTLKFPFAQLVSELQTIFNECHTAELEPGQVATAVYTTHQGNDGAVWNNMSQLRTANDEIGAQAGYTVNTVTPSPPNSPYSSIPFDRSRIAKSPDKAFLSFDQIASDATSYFSDDECEHVMLLCMQDCVNYAQNRFKKKLKCFECGSEEHLAWDCPVRKAKFPNKFKPTARSAWVNKNKGKFRSRFQSSKDDMLSKRKSSNRGFERSRPRRKYFKSSFKPRFMHKQNRDYSNVTLDDFEDLEEIDSDSFDIQEGDVLFMADDTELYPLGYVEN
jgi:hypothetical protein